MDHRVNAYRILLLAAIVLSAPFHSAWATDYTLAVNAGARQGSWNEFYERCVAIDHLYTVIGSAYGRGCAAALKKAHDEAGFNTAGATAFSMRMSMYIPRTPAATRCTTGSLLIKFMTRSRMRE
jgi:hypothetical protein